MPNETTTTLFQTLAADISNAFETDKRLSELDKVLSAMSEHWDRHESGRHSFTDEFKSMLKSRFPELAEEPTFTKLKDDRADWLKGDDEYRFMREIHEALDDRMPDDWVYQQASSIADRLTEYEDADSARDSISEIADGLVDPYNTDRAKWLASHLLNAGIVDRAIEELGFDFTGPNSTGIFGAIGLGQYVALEAIANAIIAAIEAEMEARE
jgi:hypothetical protein